MRPSVRGVGIGFAGFAVCLALLAAAVGGETGTAILYDRVLPLSHIERFDGTPASGAADLGAWKQMYSEMWRASVEEPAWPSLKSVLEQARPALGRGVIPIAVMNFKYDATEQGGGPSEVKRAFASAALKEYTYRGEAVRFRVSPSAYFTNDAALPTGIELDFGDGLGFRAVSFDVSVDGGINGSSGGAEIEVSYSTVGRKIVRVNIALSDGAELSSSFAFYVKSLQTPVPNDTLAVTAAIPYGGQYASGQAYVYLSDLNTSLTNPVIVVEGFDLDNTMDWEELYALLNQQGLVETLRADGYDAVVLNFTDATDYIQRNSFVVVELIEEVKAAIGPLADLAIVGPSMGGLCARYALAYMETHAMDHRMRTYLSFDSPHTGANIPLGVQYWMLFFSDQSESAAFMLGCLNTPAARQMLVYHLTDPAGTTGEPDPLRATFLADLAAAGDWPAGLRKVAVANGSGSGADQGFAPGDQIIFYEYDSFLVDIRGNVWAVPDVTSHVILEGLIDMIWPLPDSQLNVTVSGTRPYDSAPGGWRASMATMDTSSAPYGDIVALHYAHCFIPTVSALALDTDDLFYDIDGDPDLLSHTPFDTVYYPSVNEEHVSITPESAVWLRTETERGAAAGVDRDDDLIAVEPVVIRSSPNPFRTSTVINCSVGRRQQVRLEILDTAGRVVARLKDEAAAAGDAEVTWTGRSDRGGRVAPGVYFCRLTTEDGTYTKPVVVLR